jgi:hypothetical protein
MLLDTRRQELWDISRYSENVSSNFNTFPVFYSTILSLIVWTDLCCLNVLKIKDDSECFYAVHTYVSLFIKFYRENQRVGNKVFFLGKGLRATILISCHCAIKIKIIQRLVTYDKV